MALKLLHYASPQPVDPTAIMSTEPDCNHPFHAYLGYQTGEFQKLEYCR